EVPVHRSGASPRPAAGAVDRHRGPRGLFHLLPSADGGRPAVFRTPLPARAGPRRGSPPRPSGGPPRSVPAAPSGGLTPPRASAGRARARGLRRDFAPERFHTRDLAGPLGDLEVTRPGKEGGREAAAHPRVVCEITRVARQH